MKHDLNLVLLSKSEIKKLYGIGQKFLDLAEETGHINPLMIGQYKKYRFEEIDRFVRKNALNLEELEPIKKSKICHSKKELMDTITRHLKLIDRLVLYFNFHYKGHIDAELHEFLIDGKIFKETADKVRRYTKFSSVYAPAKKKFSRINKKEN